MKRDDFLKMAANYGPVDRQMLGEVNELISIFPYFQSAYMLLLKGLQNTSDVRFENKLRNSAMHIADREVLYYFLKKEPVPFEEIKSEALSATPVTDNISDSQQTVIESAKSSAELIDEIEKDAEATLSGNESKDRSVVISTSVGTDDSSATIIILDEETGDVEEKIFYMDPGFSLSQPADLLELSGDENLSGDDNASSGKQEQDSAPTTRKHIQSELIDRFILANPRIETPAEKSESQNKDISKPFVEERDGLLTETLARIYITQGYFSRAIDIYERLSLKFPEKSTYFASLIEGVKELINK